MNDPHDQRHQLDRIRDAEHAIDDVDEHLARVLEAAAAAKARAAAARDTNGRRWEPAPRGDR